MPARRRQRQRPDGRRSLPGRLHPKGLHDFVSSARASRSSVQSIDSHIFSTFGFRTQGTASSVNSATVPTPGALSSADVAAMVVDDAPHQAQAHAGAFELAAGVHALEGLEQQPGLGHVEAGAVVGHPVPGAARVAMAVHRRSWPQPRGRCTSTRCPAGSATPGPPGRGRLWRQAARPAGARPGVRGARPRSGPRSPAPCVSCPPAGAPAAAATPGPGWTGRRSSCPCVAPRASMCAV